MNNLKEKLEELFYSEKITVSNGQKFFYKAANFLMNECLLKIYSEYFRLIELEFYFLSEFHKDESIHNYKKKGNFHQKKFGVWYIHASGIDLTFGDENEKSAGGILVRGIRRLSDNEIFSGPITVRKPILKFLKSDSNTRKTFLGLENTNVFENENLKIINNTQAFFDKEIISYQRFGLPFKNKLADKEYRFIAEWKFNKENVHPYKEKEKVAQKIWNKEFKNKVSKEEFNKWFGYGIIKQ